MEPGTSPRKGQARWHGLAGRAHCRPQARLGGHAPTGLVGPGRGLRLLALSSKLPRNAGQEGLVGLDEIGMCLNTSWPTSRGPQVRLQ